MGKIDGSEFKLAWSTTLLSDAADATAKALSWTLAPDVSTASRGLTRPSSEFKARSGVIVTTGALKTGLSFQIAYDTTDAFYTALLDAIETNKPIALADTDGLASTAGSRGVTGNFKISDFSMDEPDEGPAVINVQAEPYSFVNPNYVAPA